MVEASEILDRVGKATTDIAGFILEKRPGDYSFMKVHEFMGCQYARGSRVWTLHKRPVPGFSQDVAVYLSTFWLEPKYAGSGFDTSKMTPLYQGPKIHEPY